MNIPISDKNYGTDINFLIRSIILFTPSKEVEGCQMIREKGDRFIFQDYLLFCIKPVSSLMFPRCTLCSLC